MKQIIKVLESLQRCPGHAADIADETGLSKKAVSAYLSDLASTGVIERIGRPIHMSLDGRGRGFVIWKIVEVKT